VNVQPAWRWSRCSVAGSYEQAESGARVFGIALPVVIRNAPITAIIARAGQSLPSTPCAAAIFAPPATAMMSPAEIRPRRISVDTDVISRLSFHG
jgi:hypothetical protein